MWRVIKLLKALSAACPTKNALYGHGFLVYRALFYCSVLPLPNRLNIIENVMQIKLLLSLVKGVWPSSTSLILLEPHLAFRMHLRCMPEMGVLPESVRKEGHYIWHWHWSSTNDAMCSHWLRKHEQPGCVQDVVRTHLMNLYILIFFRFQYL